MLPREFEPVEAGGGARVFQIAFTVLLMVIAVGGGLLAMTVLSAKRTITYRIVPGSLVIDARMGPFQEHTTVALAGVADARRVTIASWHKRNGTDAPGYCVGSFHVEGLGDVWQATDCGNDVVAVFARSGKVPVLVTPLDPDAFLRALTSGTPGTFAPRVGESRGFGPRMLALLGVVSPLLPLLGFFLALYLFLSPRRLRYTVQPGELVVKTWLVTRRVPLAGRRATRCSVGIGIRLAGTAMPGYYAGLFRSGGENLRMYATARNDGVLIESDRRVFVSPADREGFLGALREAGAQA